MSERITFPDAENGIRKHLATTLGVDTFTAITPQTLPAESVTITRTGGNESQLVLDQVRVSFDCRAKLASKAHQLAQLVRTEISAAARDGRIGELVCYQAETTAAPYLNPDPLNPNFERYTVAFQLLIRAN